MDLALGDVKELLALFPGVMTPWLPFKKKKVLGLPWWSSVGDVGSIPEGGTKIPQCTTTREKPKCHNERLDAAKFFFFKVFTVGAMFQDELTRCLKSAFYIHQQEESGKNKWNKLAKCWCFQSYAIGKQVFIKPSFLLLHTWRFYNTRFTLFFFFS